MRRVSAVAQLKCRGPELVEPVAIVLGGEAAEAKRRKRPEFGGHLVGRARKPGNPQGAKVGPGLFLLLLRSPSATDHRIDLCIALEFLRAEMVDDLRGNGRREP